MTRFARRVVVIDPGARRRYDAAEWRDALVTVDRGTIDVEPARGAPVRFVAGDVVAFDGLRVRALVNAGAEPAVLVAVSRLRGSPTWLTSAPAPRPAPAAPPSRGRSGRGSPCAGGPRSG